jgi:CysZ protein
MKAINYHIKGIETTFNTLSKGKFLPFFIPGLVLMFIFLWYTFFIASRGGFLGYETGFSWIDWIAELFESMLSFVVEQVYLFIVLTALSPFFTVLGERFDNDLTGNKFDGSFKKFFQDILRMVFVVFLMIVFEYSFILVYWIFSWFIDIPVVDSIVYFIIAAFFFGFAFYDFALERYGKGVGKSISFAFSNPLTMILTGGVFLLIYKIPYIGVPLAPVLTVMISTVVYLYNTKKLPKQELNSIENE